MDHTDVVVFSGGCQLWFRTTFVPREAPMDSVQTQRRTRLCAAVAACAVALTGVIATDARPVAAAESVTSGHSGAAHTGDIRPERFGAKGDGVTDDSSALQKAFDHAGPGHPVLLSAGHVYAHSKVLVLRRSGARVIGKGTLLATNEATSSLWIDANRVIVQGITIRTASTTTRWSAWEQMGVRIEGHTGDVLRRVRVVGSAAAGVYVGNRATHFALDHVHVAGTRADGIHITGGSSYGRVIAPVTRGTGDDGIAVVSYVEDGALCRYIRIVSPTVLGTTWGRGLSIVGGRHITETGIDVRHSDAAAVYIAAEGAPWFTRAPKHVVIDGGKIVGANTDASVDHGAILVMAGEKRRNPTDIKVERLRIVDTRATASRDFGVVTYGGTPSGIRFDHLHISGGPVSACSGNAASGSYSTHDIVQNGKLLADHR